MRRAWMNAAILIVAATLPRPLAAQQPAFRDSLLDRFANLA